MLNSSVIQKCFWSGRINILLGFKCVKHSAFLIKVNTSLSSLFFMLMFSCIVSPCLVDCPRIKDISSTVLLTFEKGVSAKLFKSRIGGNFREHYETTVFINFVIFNRCVTVSSIFFSISIRHLNR